MAAFSRRTSERLHRARARVGQPCTRRVSLCACEAARLRTRGRNSDAARIAGSCQDDRQPPSCGLGDGIRASGSRGAGASHERAAVALSAASLDDRARVRVEVERITPGERDRRAATCVSRRSDRAPLRPSAESAREATGFAARAHRCRRSLPRARAERPVPEHGRARQLSLAQEFPNEPQRREQPGSGVRRRVPEPNDGGHALVPETGSVQRDG